MWALRQSDLVFEVVMSRIEGRAKKHDGTAIDYVSIFNWIDGKCIAQVKPNDLGAWKYDYFVDLNIGITYIADGCEPVTHGPYQMLGFFEPTVLFSNNEQGVWLDPSDLSTMFQDEAGTVPVTTDGQFVGLIRDKSGNNHHARQSTASKRPKYRTDGILHWLEFDGVDDILITDTWVTNFDIGINYCVGVQRLSDGISVEKSESLFLYAGDRTATGNGWFIGSYSAYNNHYISAPNGTKSVVATYGKKQSGFYTSLNNTDVVFAELRQNPDNKNAPLSLGARVGGILPCKCNIYSVVISNNDYVEYLVSYAMDKSGIT